MDSASEKSGELGAMRVPLWLVHGKQQRSRRADLDSVDG
jgi:hypothetical protein